MKVAIFEVCRSPEIKKTTEALVLSNFFSAENIDYEVYSNDDIGSDRRVLDKDLLRHYLKDSHAQIIHLAMHGNQQGLILKWSDCPNPKHRFVQELLTPFDIQTSDEWRGKLVVSGACISALLAPAFLHAGASHVIAPSSLIPWLNLGRFFQLFYQSLFSGQPPHSALALAISHFPEFHTYQLFEATPR